MARAPPILARPRNSLIELCSLWWADHGAYYYYKPETGKDYLGTLLDVKQYADTVGIPYKWVLLDSWWYFKVRSRLFCVSFLPLIRVRRVSATA